MCQQSQQEQQNSSHHSVSINEEMERSLDPNNHGEWIRLCRQGDWGALRTRMGTSEPHTLPSQLIRWVIRSRHVKLNIVRQVIANSPSSAILQVNRLTGSLLHEAIQYYHVSPIEMFPVFQHILSLIMDIDIHLLRAQDGRGRTLLHVTLQTWQRTHNNSILKLFTTLVEIFPQLGSILDTDGHTPLMLLLLTPESEEATTNLHHLLQVLVEQQPDAISIAPKRNIPYQSIHGDIRTVSFSMTPLYCALMAGRNGETLRLLLQHRSEEIERIMTSHKEVGLHVAVTCHASNEILALLSNDQTIQSLDADGLSPLDWAWLVAVRGGDPHPSRRRYLPEYVIERKACLEKCLLRSSSDKGTTDDAFLLLDCDALVCRLQAMLLGEYTSTAVSILNVQIMLQRLCQIQCPAALVCVLLRYYHSHFPNARNVASYRDDARRHRMAIHHAVTKRSYDCCYRVGVFGRTVQVDVEDATVALKSIIECMPISVRMTDAVYQLPLHIAIEESDHQRRDLNEAKDDSRSATVDTGSVYSTLHRKDQQHQQHTHCSDPRINSLLKAYPGATVRRDGKTFLYPALQAACFESPQLTLIYELLRLDPTVLL